jgi:predicted dinucleotide-binding enzyme
VSLLKIGIIGTGAIGGTLARGLANLGHQVSIANSRGPETLKELTAQIGAKAVSVWGVARAGDVVIFSIPQKAVLQLPKDLFASVPSSGVVIDTCNYFPQLRDVRIEALEAGTLDSTWVAEHLGRPVVKAFNNIVAKSRSRVAECLVVQHAHSL